MLRLPTHLADFTGSQASCLTRSNCQRFQDSILLKQVTASSKQATFVMARCVPFSIRNIPACNHRWLHSLFYVVCIGHLARASSSCSAVTRSWQFGLTADFRCFRSRAGLPVLAMLLWLAFLAGSCSVVYAVRFVRCSHALPLIYRYLLVDMS